MSVIYTSADTAETVNRAAKNIQGTTTTTDGITVQCKCNI